MLIGILSDTHDRLPTFEAAIKGFRNAGVEAVFHAGDYVAPFAARLLSPESPGALKVPVHCIYGNNDGERDGLRATLPQIIDGPMQVRLETPRGSRIIAMAHYLDWFTPETLTGAEVVISGHDHEAKIERRQTADGSKLFVNPGECCGWVNGRCTAALLDLAADPPEAELLELTP